MGRRLISDLRLLLCRLFSVPSGQRLSLEDRRSFGGVVEVLNALLREFDVDDESSHRKSFSKRLVSRICQLVSQVRRTSHPEMPLGNPRFVSQVRSVVPVNSTNSSP